LLPFFIGSFFGPLPVTSYLLGGLGSLLFFPIGYGMGWFVLGLQLKNPLCPRKTLRTVCKVAFYFFGLGGIVSSLAELGTLQSSEFMPINLIPAGFGLAYAAFKIRRKTVA